jgi:hypothetical protein
VDITSETARVLSAVVDAAPRRVVEVRRLVAVVPVLRPADRARVVVARDLVDRPVDFLLFDAVVRALRDLAGITTSPLWADSSALPTSQTVQPKYKW